MDRVFGLFARILEYPWDRPARAARDCAAAVEPLDREAARRLRSFAAFVRRAALGRLQEAYSRMFELDPSCPPYLGHQLFGETYRRSAFLVGLAERYQERGMVVEGELPDHLAVVLRYLSLSPPDEEMREMVTEALVPALDKMCGKHGSERGYGAVLEALRLVLRRVTPSDAAVAPSDAAAGGQAEDDRRQRSWP